MRIAIISDIHANLVALETVLADIARERVDQIVCLGDIYCNGSQPRAVVHRLQEINCSIVRGNADEVVFNLPDLNPQTEQDRQIAEIILWSAAQLESVEKTFVASFPLRLEFAFDGEKNLLCYHGSPQSNTDEILATTPDDQLARMINPNRATIFVGGHTHTQMFRRFREGMIINPGSVGMPIERNATGQIHRPPWSEYAIVESRNGELGVEFKRVPLDVRAVVRAARASGMPHVETWVAEWRE